MTSSTTPLTTARRERERRQFWALSALMVVALVVFAVSVVALHGTGATRAQRMPMTSTPMFRVAPGGQVSLDSLSPEIAAEYRYAAAHTDAYHQIRCWCGCDRALGHRDLVDCFVRASGEWEAHGFGCAVCLDEAKTAHTGLDGGVAPTAIAATLDARYQPNPAPTGA